MDKLISTTDFVLEQKEYIKEVDNLSFFEIQTKINEFYDKVVHHATQIKRVVEKGMFVPTDGVGNVLEEPTMEKYGYYFSNHQEEQSGWMYEEGEDEYYKVLEKYQQVKENVLFDGFYSTDENTVSNGEINIIFGNLITIIVLVDNGYGGISKNQMIVEDLVEYNLTITDEF